MDINENEEEEEEILNGFMVLIGNKEMVLFFVSSWTNTEDKSAEFGLALESVSFRCSCRRLNPNHNFWERIAVRFEPAQYGSTSKQSKNISIRKRRKKCKKQYIPSPPQTQNKMDMLSKLQADKIAS